MSFSSPAIGASSLSTPVVDPSTEPASVRNGDQTAKNAYSTGVAFEQMLMSQLTQTMTATIGGSDSSDGLGGSSNDGLGGSSADGSSDAGLGAYSSMLPDALTSGIMANGGTGIAMQIAESIDPALANPTLAAATAGATGSGVTTPSGGVGLASTPLTAPATATGSGGVV